MPELKPCPFCGGEAILLEDWKDGNFIVGCANNDCIARLSGIPSFDNAEQAVKAWNTRAERTCFVQYEYTGEPFFHSIHVHELSCGHDVRLYEDAPIYCPYCGAKVA